MKMKNSCIILVGKTEGKISLGRHRHGRIILKWILRVMCVKKWNGMELTGSG
jgi:hypothetical protein